MSVASKKLRYFGKEIGFVRVPRKVRADDDYDPNSDPERGSQDPDIEDVSQEEKERLVNYAPSFVSRLTDFNQTLKEQEEAGQYVSRKEKVALAKDVLTYWQAELDGALGFDDDLAKAANILSKLRSKLYRGEFKKELEYDYLQTVRQIALASDREWQKAPESKHDNINSYEELQASALFILYDHQIRRQDLDSAKNLADFLKKRADITQLSAPVAIDGIDDIGGSFNINCYRKSSQEFGGHTVKLFKWVQPEFLPEFLDYMYSSRNPLLKKVILNLPHYIEKVIGAPKSENFVQEEKNEYGNSDGFRIKVKERFDYAVYKPHDLIKFLRALQGSDFCAEEAGEALNSLDDLKQKGLSALDDLRRQAEEAKVNWANLFTPSNP